MATQSTIANSINSIINQSNSAIASSGVMQAIKNAAAKTGVDFSYLVKNATQESGLNPTAQASTSSATGLFQFTNQTWLQMVKNSGAQYGLGAYAAQINEDSSGHLSITDPAARQAILALRNDPTISAEMAGELNKQNAASLQQNVGGAIGGTELYLAHFLGAGGASDFINTMRSAPNATAASVVPAAAAANPSVFYTNSGQPRTLKEIYQHFAQKFDGTSISIPATPSVTASSKNSYAAVASTSTVSSTMASLTSISAAATAGFSTANTVSKLTNTGSSTLFTAMLLGQMNGSSLDPSALSNDGLPSDKQKNAMEILAAAA